MTLADLRSRVAFVASRISIAEAAERCGVHLEPQGRDHTGPCLFCQGVDFWAVTPFSDATEPYYYCFSCKRHGTVVGFWMRAKSLGYFTALDDLAELAA